MRCLDLLSEVLFSGAVVKIQVLVKILFGKQTHPVMG